MCSSDLALEQQEKWPELQLLATGWARADTTDPEPWYLLGLALLRQDRRPEALQALECSLAIEPRYPPALLQWSELAQPELPQQLSPAMCALGAS